MARRALIRLAAAGALWLAAAVAAAAQTIAIVYDEGGKFDKSFNQAAHQGLLAVRPTLSRPPIEIELATGASRADALDRAAAAAELVIVVGSRYAGPLAEVAARRPGARFTLIDGGLAAPNVQSIRFREQEGAFLVGYLAARSARRGVIGFIGGMDIPVIRRFSDGYVAGARYASPTARVLIAFMGDDAAGFTNPFGGYERALDQIAAGAEVLFAAAGRTGIGVYQAAKDRGALAIGVDSNQNHLQPGAMLTSMVKRVDRAVERAARSLAEGDWRPGVVELGLADQAVGWTLDRHNGPLIPERLRGELARIEADIIAGRIKIE